MGGSRGYQPFITNQFFFHRIIIICILVGTWRSHFSTISSYYTKFSDVRSSKSAQTATVDMRANPCVNAFFLRFLGEHHYILEEFVVCSTNFVMKLGLDFWKMQYYFLNVCIEKASIMIPSVIVFSLSPQTANGSSKARSVDGTSQDVASSLLRCTGCVCTRICEQTFVKNIWN